MRAHGQKEPLVAPRSKNSKGKTKFASFKEHIDAICNGMRVSDFLIKAHLKTY